MPVVDQGQTQALHSLYSHHHLWLQSWLHRKVGNHCDAADIAHDTFLRLMNRRRDIRALGKEPRALLTHIARHLLIDHWRRQDVERAYLDTIAHLSAPEVPSPETRWLILETLQNIDAMLSKLPGLTREIFLFAQLDGLKYADIADRLNISQSTVKRHMRRGFLACLSLD